MNINWIKILGVLLLMTALPSRAANLIVDTDRDNVPDWEDYCPNTPPGKAVWTLETVKAAKGDPRWVGCTENELPPNASFTPPSQKVVLASLVNELDAFNRNLASSFEEIAKSSPKSKALIYRKAAILINRSSANALETLCGNRLLLDLTLPLLETQSARVFEKTIVGAKVLSRLLGQSSGSRCERLDPSPGLRTMLELLQTGWKALAGEGSAENDLSQISTIKTKLGVAMAAVSKPGFKEALRDLIDAQEKAKPLMESFDENDLIVGISVMLQSLGERLKLSLRDGRPSANAMTAEERLTLPPGLARAARLPIGGGGGANEALFGTWAQSGCKVIHESIESIRRFYIFTEKGGVSKTAFFAGTETCAGLPAVMQVIEFSHFDVGNAVPEPQSAESSSGFAPAMQLDVTWGRTLVTALTQIGVDGANSIHSCGFSDWQLGVAKDLTGLNCDTALGVFSAPPQGQIGRTIFKVIENDPQGTGLYLGRGKFSLPGPHPTDLDLDEKFLKITRIPSYLKESIE